MTTKPTQKIIHIHFICAGNAYRSRLAETYLKSKKIPHIRTSSSGLEAEKNKFGNGPASWYTIRLAHRYNLLPFLSPIWTQTTPKHFMDVDLIVFMHPEHFEKSQAMFGYDGTKHIIWNIPDLGDLGFKYGTSEPAEEIGRIEATEKTFSEIKKRVDDLIEYINSTLVKD